MRFFRLQRYIVFIVCCQITVFPAYAQEQAVTFPTASLAIKTLQKTISFTVEVADTPQQQEHGLMFRKSLDHDHGMIFDFKAPRHVDFWMKNTLIPLDMIFIDNNGTVTQIVENAEPESTRTIPSDQDVRAVLEVAGGVVKQDRIAKGDRVIYSIFP
jgi:uncharacterized membrane protein (UPF0127 family)